MRAQCVVAIGTGLGSGCDVLSLGIVIYFDVFFIISCNKKSFALQLKIQIIILIMSMYPLMQINQLSHERFVRKIDKKSCVAWVFTPLLIGAGVKWYQSKHSDTAAVYHGNVIFVR